MDEQVLPLELAEEDGARADCYAVVSRLFYAPPDAELLASLSAEPAPGDSSEAVRGDNPLAKDYARAFAALRDACRSADAAALRQEYDDLFIGAGKALVSPYTSAYAAPQAPDRHLVALREHLAAWGLARRASVFEVEDHVSAVCDGMRWLIASNRPLAEQRRFFDDFVFTGVVVFCGAIKASAPASFYRSVAAFAHAFVAIENDAFTLHSGE
jgi:TorA maturation chaperone TorD